MYGLDLFSGIGGLTKAFEGYVRPIAYCENDRYAQGVLLSRMSEGELPMAPIWDDVITLRGSMLPSVDIIYGGFPCQDISVAKRIKKGMAGERSGLFSQICRLSDETNCEWIFLENVPNIFLHGFGIVLRELVKRGFSCRWELLSAAAVGAPQNRQRFFLLAHRDSFRRGDELSEKSFYSIEDSKRAWKNKATYISARRSESEYERNPNDIRMADGIPFYVERLRAMGNSVVPQQAREAFERLMGLKPSGRGMG